MESMLAEKDQLKLAGVVSEIAAYLNEGQELSVLASRYQIDVETMKTLAESALVSEALSELQFKQVHKQATMARGWAGLEELCLSDMIDKLQNSDLSAGELVQITRVSLDAQKPRNVEPAQVFQPQTYVNLNFNSPVRPEGAMVGLAATKVESVLPQGEVQKLFNGADAQVGDLK